MEHRPFGRTGVLVSPICLGAMNFGGPTSAADSEKILLTALDAGINFVDTANVYNDGESERIVGEVLAASGRRHEVFLATKAGMPLGVRPFDRDTHSRRHLMASCEASLRRLRTDHVDLFQIHKPSSDVPSDEILAALDDLVRTGKVRYIGSSTHPAWMVMEALATSERLHLARYVSEQPPYNLLDRRVENELVPLCERYGLALIPWSPLGGGILAGRYAKDTPPPADSRAARKAVFGARVTRAAIDVAVAVERIARQCGLSAAQLALVWVKDQPAVTAPIIGPRTLDQLTPLVDVAGITLDSDTRDELDELVPPGSAVADFFNTVDWMKMRIRSEGR